MSIANTFFNAVFEIWIYHEKRKKKNNLAVTESETWNTVGLDVRCPFLYLNFLSFSLNKSSIQKQP